MIRQLLGSVAGFGILSLSLHATTINYQPDGVTGVDTFVSGASAHQSTSFGDQDTTHTWWDSSSSSGAWKTYSYFQFDLSTQPSAADTSSATLRLHQTIGRSYGWDYTVLNPHMDLYVITGAWDESVTWNTRPTIDVTAVSSTQLIFDPTNPTDGYHEFFAGWIEFDVTAVYQDWQDGSITNFGLAMRRREPFGENAISHLTQSSDSLSTSLRPMLTIEAVPEPSSTFLLGLGGLALVLRRRK